MRSIKFIVFLSFLASSGFAQKGINFLKSSNLNTAIATAKQQNKLLFVEGNPVPVKWALAQMGRMPLGYRLPLVNLSAQFHAPLRAAMVEAGLL